MADAGGPRRETGSRTILSILKKNTFTLVNGIALGFLVLIAAAQAWNDAIFAAVIVINLMIGVTQEVRAKRKLDRIALLVAPQAHVRRDGVLRDVGPDSVVVDDIVELQPGDQVVADGVVVSSAALALDESILTGETNPVARDVGEAVQSGAYCASGAGVFRVTAVGADSFAGRLTSAAREGTTSRSLSSRRSTAC